VTTPPPWPSPGHPPQQPYGPPQSWYPPPPPPAPVTRRIPEDQPFVVRPSVAKRGLVFAAVALVVLLPLGCLAGLGVSQGTDAQDRGDALLGVLAMGGCVLLLIALPLGLQLWLIASGGPVLAVGPAGLWIRSRPTRGQAVWLPWQAVAQISRRRWALEKMLVVKPHDGRALQHLGVFTALDSGLLAAAYGSGLVATLNFADRSESEILAAVAHYSAGRCPIV
jgi:hypothetical protein